MLNQEFVWDAKCRAYLPDNGVHEAVKLRVRPARACRVNFFAGVQGHDGSGAKLICVVIVRVYLIAASHAFSEPSLRNFSVHESSEKAADNRCPEFGFGVPSKMPQAFYDRRKHGQPPCLVRAFRFHQVQHVAPACFWPEGGHAPVRLVIICRTGKMV